MIAGTKGMPITLMHIKTDRKTGKAAAEAHKELAKEAGQTVKEIAGQVDSTPEERPATSVTTIVQAAAKPEAIAAEAEKGYGLMIVGLEKTVTRGHEFHDDVTALAAGFDGPLAVVDARDRHLKEPLVGRLSILAPVNGTETSRRAAEVAIVLARASGCPLTALYVAPGGRNKKRSRQYEEAILKDIVALADTYEVTLRTAVRADIAPEEAILKETTRRRHNLVVLGAERRPGEKLFFGDTAAALLEKSEKSLLFVAS
jgi:nucleotide-binding universal stress UspA family protein